MSELACEVNDYIAHIRGYGGYWQASCSAFGLAIDEKTGKPWQLINDNDSFKITTNLKYKLNKSPYTQNNPMLRKLKKILSGALIHLIKCICKNEDSSYSENGYTVLLGSYDFNFSSNLGQEVGLKHRYIMHLGTKKEIGSYYLMHGDKGYVMIPFQDDKVQTYIKVSPKEEHTLYIVKALMRLATKLS